MAKKYPINRPKTSFAMKANLVQREPEFHKRWEKIGLYDRVREQDHPAGPFVFHDGPPYANGDIHLGHLLNKVLKDLVVRTRTMAGHDVNFVPGWDCHGLPIEHKVMKETAAGAGKMDVMKVRHKCRAYAEKYHKLQAKQMQRLGTTGDYANPYLTMDPNYEGGVLEVFAAMVGEGLVYRALKPVHWSIANQTALADAELEYYDREDTSIYVMFDLAKMPPAAGHATAAGCSLMIWTTTPWTLPANLAVAVSAKAEYGVYRLPSGNTTIIACDLAEKVLTAGGAPVHKPMCTFRGQDLVGAEYRHPFIDRTSPVVTADYVTLEDGTGLVHTAPGHGVEDYQTGLRENLGVYCPVQDDGTFDDTAPQWLQGVDVWKANELVLDKLRENGHLFHDHQFMHSYPHDWRSKTPVIFRATEQWFVSVDEEFGLASERTPSPQPSASEGEGVASLRQRALDVTQADVKFIPEWGRNRMRGMLESRPDWCISRQRAWGLPIPAFFGPEKGQTLLTQASVQAVTRNIRKHGSDLWFKGTVEQILDGYDPANDPHCPEWFARRPHASSLKPSQDIFDVWFESGASWYACMVQRGLAHTDGRAPVDLYLEGSDQHRGWFQVSLLTSLAAAGRPAFAEVLTHGFIVDKHGMKLSKSDGNAISVEDLMKEHGADVCRWWVASINFENDIKADMEFFRLAGEEYRKVRNTIRFLLSNLDGFDPRKDRRELNDREWATLDAWAMGCYRSLRDGVAIEYKNFRFRFAAELIFGFCNETMSSVYLAAVKDRLYCDRIDSDRRRRTQTVMYDIAEGLIRLVAPILVHTADEAWLSLHNLGMDSQRCVHLEQLPPAAGPLNTSPWSLAMEMRSQVLKHIEDKRAHCGIDNPLDLGVTVAVPPERYRHLVPFEAEMADLCGVSRFAFVEDGSQTIDVADLSTEPRCERSWKRDGTVAQYTDADGDKVMLSSRDAEALGLA